MLRSPLVIAAGLAVTALALPDARSQPPEPVAEERLDINGDGAPDTVRLDRPPGVSILLADDQAGSSWFPLTTSGPALVGGTITTGRGAAYGGAVVIAVEAAFEGAGGRTHEALVVAWRGGALEKVWQGVVGRQGRDGDYDERVEATAKGLLRYQQRADVRRCDGQPAYLFPERYDFRERRFRPIYNAPRVAAGAPVLRATRQPPPGAAAGGAGLATAAVFRARAASAQAGARTARELAPPREIDDGRADTAWREDLGGDGRGEFITATAAMSDQTVVAVRLIPGDASSARAFGRANRLRRAALLVGKAQYVIELATDPARDAGSFADPYWAVLPRPEPASCATLVVMEVYPGSAASGAGTGETAIAELAVLTPIDLTPGGAEAALAAQVATGGPAAVSAGHALEARGAAGIAALLDAADAADGTDAAARTRLWRVLARAIAPRRVALEPAVAARAAGALAAGVAAEGASPADRAQLGGALAALGQVAVEPLGALVAGAAAPEARQAAARALAEIPGPAAHAALVAAAGREPAPVRREVARALGARPAAELALLVDAIAQAEAAGDTAREADLWRALGHALGHALGRGGPGDARARALAALRARLASATGYELRYRLFAAAGAHGDAGALAALDRALPGRASPGRAPGDAHDAHNDALRRVAARALGESALSEARTMLVALADDRDPGVRKAALAQLAQRGADDAAAERVLIARLADDRWPQIRRLAAAGLALRCASPEPAAALTAALDRDPDPQVRRDAVGALVACRAAGVAELLVAVARNRAQPATVRARAITLMPELPARDARALAAPLASLFESYRRAVWAGDADALRLAQAAAAAMGRVGGPGAAAPLLQAARDPAFPEIQAAAVIGLGALCPPQARELLARLARSAERQVSLAARRASAQCRRP